jgi:hypothetical protein
MAIKKDQEQLEAVFDKDTQRFRRYIIDGAGFNGSLYFRKGRTVPKQVVVTLPKPPPLRDEAE